jgi:glucose-1-phosphate cytidylyltransferase
LKVVILCGGKGTRLYEETEYRPKPMVKVGGFPVVWHIMKMYAHHGFREFILCLGYRGNKIKEYFLNYRAMTSDFTIDLGRENQIQYHNSQGENSFTVTLVDTGLDTMTGSRVKQIEKYIDGETFMVTYGDGLSDINLRDLLKFHQSHNAIATITTVYAVSRFGTVRLSTGDHVTEFIEKPRLQDWISAGFFVFNREVFRYLDDDPSCVLEQAPLKALAADGQLMAYRHEGFFFAMDTYREYLYLNELWNTGKAHWKVW